ncbi:AraC family transcriptional regulator [Pokkaliibacter plantistimulans]|uniref:AraC family transcriptional regulator n=1 Tax=Pokkaliibacter plantistimulans TaxID=1635171 RepID=A0ABX5LSB5_9GAMM|nr:AraC family transcriptional regulator [Pokkaliibacter plantistimulans]PXF29502.1 AraC family transcriptional regulator [Pokkaliibacter plantistimulans]
MFDISSETSALNKDPLMDLMSELLLGMRMSGLHYCQLQLVQPFGLRLKTEAGRAQFHFVAQGIAYLRCPSGQLLVLQAGDAVLLPRGGTHELLSDEQVACRDITEIAGEPVCWAFSTLRNHDMDTPSPISAQLFSGCMAFDLGGLHPLVALMPEVMHVGTLLSRYPELLSMLQAMSRESELKRAGAAAILARLADVVSAYIVRGWVECGCSQINGWVEALRDPRMGKVIAMVHKQPGHNWTVAEMASVMGASRSVFAERFRAVVGVSPLQYVTSLRMRLAHQWLTEDRQTPEQVAWRLGYASQAAFSRAFKRETGATPGSLKL